MIMCRALEGNFDFNWNLGHRFFEISTLAYVLTGEMSANKIADALGIPREDELHTGIGGARQEAAVLRELLDLGFTMLEDRV